MRAMHRAAAGACLAFFFAACMPALAVRIEGDKPSTGSAQVSPPRAEAKRVELASGVIAAVDANRRVITINDTQLTWQAGKLTIYLPGGVLGSPHDLRAGNRIRFAYQRNQVVLVYVDARQ